MASIENQIDEQLKGLPFMLKTRQVAEATGLKIETVRAMKIDGQLPTQVVSKNTLVPRTALREWMITRHQDALEGLSQ